MYAKSNYQTQQTCLTLTDTFTQHLNSVTVYLLTQCSMY